eukprot:TRINITY_DN9311_c0_g1_i5.p1 TRINITY_DN9311_c0_g1~~TRINITY_DN9311_c0_g1_i5.p1  ORF type:complete len:111 (-),score=34.61 TRINITY_DN9311_c0_g1_i5:88-420(-)
MESKAVFTDIKEDVAGIVNETVERQLKSKAYSPSDVQSWTSDITSEILSRLQLVSANFKYIATCAIMQKCESGLNVSTSCYWSTNTDGDCALKWENESLYCIVNVFSIAL